MDAPDSRRVDPGAPWIVSAICADCLDSPQGQAVLNGLVGVASISDEGPDRCVFCGFVFADQTHGEG